MLVIMADTEKDSQLTPRMKKFLAAAHKAEKDERGRFILEAAGASIKMTEIEIKDALAILRRPPLLMLDLLPDYGTDANGGSVILRASKSTPSNYEAAASRSSRSQSS
jgi:hypothetical protein